MSGFTRELKKNFPLQKRYTPRLAHERALEKRRSRGRQLRLKNQFIRRKTTEWLKAGYSPEQISGTMKKDKLLSVSHETIYKYICIICIRNIASTRCTFCSYNILLSTH